MLKQDKKGFTIIEVLIVLAIGGLIMLIVFLAVPALQRNSRNTQRKNDVSLLLGGMTDHAAANNGTLPTDTAALFNYVKPGYYSGTGTSVGQVSVVNMPAANQTLTVNAANDRVIIYKGARCTTSGSPAVATATAGSARQFVAMYLLETNNSWVAQCQEG